MNPYLKIPTSAIVTYSGKIIEPLNPDPEQIDIEDIAHALANQCRFTGHTREFYSVAQHSVLVSEICDEQDALWGLLHDASEAYLSDIARPIKRCTEWGNGYTEVEQSLMAAVEEAFDLHGPYYDIGMPASVKHADDILLRTEMRDLMPEGVDATMPGEMLEGRIRGWMPGVAKELFLKRYYEIVEG